MNKIISHSGKFNLQTSKKFEHFVGLWYNHFKSFANHQMMGGKYMDVSYNKLFKMLIDKGLNKTEFAKEVGISTNTLAKFSRNEFVSMEILVRICRKLNCTVDDIMEILPETKERG